MKIVFSPVVPWSLAIIAFVLLSGISVWIYRKHSLSSPWIIILPGLRIAVIALLVLMLKQPRFIHVEKREEKGKIAVLIDNSGSMSVSDDYSLARQVELAARFKLFEPSIRCADFVRESEYLSDVGRNLQRITRRLQGMEQSASRRNLEEVDRGITEINDFFTISHTALEGVPKRMRAASSAYDYLSVDTPQGGAPKVQDSRARGLTYKRWEGIDGALVKNLIDSPKFKMEPDETRLIPNFDAPQNAGSLTGTTINGYLHPPLSGNYVFHIASDDQGILYLSSDRDPANKQEICKTHTWTAYRKFNLYPEQKSKPIRLEAHKLYFVEAIMKELSGRDHLTVGWTRPDGRVETPVPGEYLTPFGVKTSDYFGPDFDRLHPQVIQLSNSVLTHFNDFRRATTTVFESGMDGMRSSSFISLRKDLRELKSGVDDLRRNVKRLQESADMRLAFAGVEPVNKALLRLRRMNRADLVRDVLTGKAYGLLAELEKTADPKLFVLGKEARLITPSELPVLRNRLGKTDLATNIRDVLKYFENQFIAGILVVSDGNDNSGHDLRDIRKIASDRDVPLICLGVGSTQPPRDVAVEGVISPDNSFRNDEITVTVVIKRDGYTGETIELTVISDGETLCTERVPPGLESRVSVDLTFRETRDGPLEYTVMAQQFITEQVSHNNRRTFKVNILKDPIRVLMIDSFPRWETRYLVMMLERDQRFHVKPVYCGMGDVVEPKPLELDESLLSYDLLIVGDVDPSRFTGDQYDAIRSFLTEHQGTIVLLAGRHFMPHKYLNTPLADFLPLNEISSREALPKRPAKITPTMTAESSFDSMVRIAGTPEISRRLWEGLPALDWVATNVVTSRVADELIRVESTEIPILVRSLSGQGNLIYVGSDSFWRWRDRANWRYYHRFWGQILLWAALDRTGSSNPFVKLLTQRPEYHPNEPIEVNVRILDINGMPLNNTRPTLEVYDQSTEKAVKIVRMQYVEDSDGKYVAILKNLPFGKYRATAHVPALDGKEAGAELYFEVRNLPGTEYMNLTLNPSALKSLATHYLPLERAGEVPALVPELRIPRTYRREWELWNMFPAIALIALLLGLEWYFRKRQKLS